jgi:hypothetical protein
MDCLCTEVYRSLTIKKLLKIEDYADAFAAQGGDGIADFRRVFVRQVEVVEAVGKSNLRSKLEVLEVDLKSHSCLYGKVSASSDDGVQVDFLLGLGVEKVAATANKVHAGIVEAHGPVLKNQGKFHLCSLVDQLLGTVAKGGNRGV